MSNLTRDTFRKIIKPGMQTENLANNNPKQFYVLLTTNQIKLYTYPDWLKKNPLLRKFLNSESTAYFLDETSQSSALKNGNLSYLVGSVDKNNVYFHMTCLLPKYWKLLPLSHTFIDHAASSFWGCSLELLSIITASANWGTVFDLEILTWLLLHTKVS